MNNIPDELQKNSRVTAKHLL
ncbi:Protein of unknown function [Lactobacillus helveticus CIRM-BIA 951]|uniref:Uncharacterized protein n=1 Tax=Lactobacillus helveticus CIRM-BIA 951 TaxID=1226334 RepID=U6EZL6_LACHE|nr:Protein of unknown function [Lactobacillus helveticus CIRM-BIA 951]